MATAYWRPEFRPSEDGDEVRRELLSGGDQEPPAATLLVTYVVLVPLIFFAVHGAFSFEYGSLNSDLGAYGGKIAIVSSSSEAFRESLQSWIALALCLAPIAVWFRRILAISGRMRLMLILPWYAITSAIWSQDPGLSLRSGVLLLAMTLFAFYLTSRFSHRQQMELVMLAGACVATASVAMALFWPRYGIDHQLHEGAWQGLFTQKNMCAEAMLFLLTPALALPSVGRYGQLSRAIYVLLGLFVILMTRSMTGWAVTILYLGFACLLRALGKFERKDLLPIAGLLFAISSGMVAAAIQYPSFMLALIGRSDTLTGRIQIWSAITASILRRPIGGYGYNAFWLLVHGEASRVFAAVGWVVTSAHNGFLNVGLELGLVGLALVAATFVQAFRHANATFYPGHSRYVDWCIGIVFLTLIYNLDERTLMATEYLPWVLYIVACTGLSEAAGNTKSKRIVPIPEEARA